MDPVFLFTVKELFGMGGMYVTKEEASKLLGVSLRMITNYLKSGDLTEHHKNSRNVMIDIVEVYDLREKITNRKRGKTK